MLSVIKNIHPRDGIEAMLGAQMAALRIEYDELHRSICPAPNTPQQEMAGGL